MPLFRQRTNSAPASRKARLLHARHEGVVVNSMYSSLWMNARKRRKRGTSSSTGKASVIKEVLIMLLVFAVPILIILQSTKNSSSSGGGGGGGGDSSLWNTVSMPMSRSVLQQDGTPQTTKNSGDLIRGTVADAPANANENGFVSGLLDQNNGAKAQMDPQQQKHQAITTSTQGTDTSNTIAYVVPLWNCKDKALTDAAITLRHSIHLQSKRSTPDNTRSKGSVFSVYDYHMYALVLDTAASTCPDQLQIMTQLGYTVVTVANPVEKSKIRSEPLQQFMGKEKGQTMKDYIQLQAHVVVKEDVMVVLELDTLVLKPLDPLFDAILNTSNTARQQIHLEPSTTATAEATTALPPTTSHSRIDAFFVRDYPHTGYNRTPVVMVPGFWVARRDPTIVKQALDVIYKPNIYKQGNDPTSGWGEKGYTMYYSGGMTFAGFYTYFMDHIMPTSRAVELNSCRYHHSGQDNLFRNAPRFHPALAERYKGQCRSGAKQCEDCTKTAMTDIYTVHYSPLCKKSWTCTGEGSEGGGDNGMKVNTRMGKIGKYIHHLVGDHQYRLLYPHRSRMNLITHCFLSSDHCLKMQKKWHEIRKDAEDTLRAKAKDSKLLATGNQGQYKPGVFKGHCSAAGGAGYNTIKGITPGSMTMMSKLVWGDHHQQDKVTPQ